MLDTIHLYRYTKDLGTLPERYRQVKRRKPPKHLPWEVQIKNLSFKVRPIENGQYKIDVEGSISKFLKGHNYYNPTYLEILRAFMLFKKQLNLYHHISRNEIPSRGISNFKFSRVDIALNIKTNELARKYFSIFIHSRGYLKNESQEDGIYFNTKSGRKTILIYDKDSEQEHQKKNQLEEDSSEYDYKTLRIEFKFQYDIQNVFGFNSIGDLYNRKDGMSIQNLENVVQVYLHHFNKIQKRSIQSLEGLKNPRDIINYFARIGIEKEGGKDFALQLINDSCSRNNIPNNIRNRYRERINELWRDNVMMSIDPLAEEVSDKVYTALREFQNSFKID